MKNLLKPLGIIVLVTVIGFTMASCAMVQTVGGTAGMYGFFTGNGSSAAITDGAEEIASYSVILGIVDSGYAEYVAAVKAAEDSGKKVSSVTKWIFFIVKTTAYAR
jgi:hypothetical protein